MLYKNMYLSLFEDFEFIKKKDEKLNQFFDEMKERENINDDDILSIYNLLDMKRSSLRNNKINFLNKTTYPDYLYFKDADFLTNDIITYDNISDLIGYLDLSETINKWHKLIPNLKGIRNKIPKNDNVFMSLVANLSSMDDSYNMWKNFLKKSNKYNTSEEFISGLKKYINDTGLDNFEIISKINDINSADIVFNDEKYIVAMIYDYNASKQLGSSQWCISTGTGAWDTTCTGNSIQYFIWDYTVDKSSAKHKVGITLNAKNGQVTDAHLMNDNDISTTAHKLPYFDKLHKIGDLSKYTIGKILKYNPSILESNADILHKFTEREFNKIVSNSPLILNYINNEELFNSISSKTIIKYFLQNTKKNRTSDIVNELFRKLSVDEIKKYISGEDIQDLIYTNSRNNRFYGKDMDETKLNSLLDTLGVDFILEIIDENALFYVNKIKNTELQPKLADAIARNINNFSDIHQMFESFELNPLSVLGSKLFLRFVDDIYMGDKYKEASDDDKKLCKSIKFASLKISIWEKTDEDIVEILGTDTYIFISRGTDDAPFEIDGETYYKKTLAIDKMVKIDTTNSDDLSVVFGMKMAANANSATVYTIKVDAGLFDEIENMSSREIAADDDLNFYLKLIDQNKNRLY